MSNVTKRVTHAFRKPGITYRTINCDNIGGRQVYEDQEPQPEVHFSSDTFGDDDIVKAIASCLNGRDNFEYGIIDDGRLLNLDFNVFVKSNDPLFAYCVEEFIIDVDRALCK